MTPRAATLAVALACVAVLTAAWVGPGSGGRDGHVEPPARPFSATSFWNTPLVPDSPVDPLSQVYVNRLHSQLRQRGVWINAGRFSAPVYTVPADQPPVRVSIDSPSDLFTNDTDKAELERQLADVPIPPAARAARGTDAHMVVWQPSSDTMWELWQAHKAPRDGGWWGHTEPAGWHAAWGARTEHVSQSSGVNAYPFGSTASGLSVLGGLMRTNELRAGQIDHALALAIPSTAQGVARPPANRTDGQDPSPTAIPEGTRFRLDPTLDIDSLHLHPIARAMAVAAQRYGIVVRDRADAVVFYAEAPRAGDRDPYPGLFAQGSAAAELGGFPWDRLQALAPPG